MQDFECSWLNSGQWQKWGLIGMKFNSDETILPTCAQTDFRFIYLCFPAASFSPRPSNCLRRSSSLASSELKKSWGFQWSQAKMASQGVVTGPAFSTKFPMKEGLRRCELTIEWVISLQALESKLVKHHQNQHDFHQLSGFFYHTTCFKSPKRTQLPSHNMKLAETQHDQRTDVSRFSHENSYASLLNWQLLTIFWKREDPLFQYTPVYTYHI